MKKAIWIMMTALLLGFLIGLYLYSKNNNEKADDIIEILVNNDTKQDVKYTNNNIIKTSPNTIVIKKIYYTDCNHVIEIKETINQSMVNLTEAEFKEKYWEWDIKKFDIKEIVMYKQEEGYCKEHYILQDDNGYIAIYEMNNQDKIAKLYRKTDILIKYLTEEDRKNLENGIKVYTKEKLNKVIEDFDS